MKIIKKIKPLIISTSLGTVLFGSKPDLGSFVLPKEESSPLKDKRTVYASTYPIEDVLEGVETTLPLTKDLIMIVAYPYQLNLSDDRVKELEELAINIICERGYKTNLIEIVVKIFSNSMYFNSVLADHIRNSFINLLEKYPNIFDRQLVQDMKEIANIHEQAKSLSFFEQREKRITIEGNLTVKRNKFRETYGFFEFSKVIKARDEYLEAWKVYKKVTEKMKEAINYSSYLEKFHELSKALNKACDKLKQEMADFEKRRKEYKTIQTESLLHLFLSKMI